MEHFTYAHVSCNKIRTIHSRNVNEPILESGKVTETQYKVIYILFFSVPSFPKPISERVTLVRMFEVGYPFENCQSGHFQTM